jgi:hypothetical protein
MSRAGVLLLCSLLGVWLSGCGEATSDTEAEGGSTATPASDSSPTDVPDGPACAEVWVDGNALPESYRGCVDGDTWVKAEATRCDSGQVLIVYGDRFYGAKGAVVNDVSTALQESAQYRRAVRACG